MFLHRRTVASGFGVLLGTVLLCSQGLGETQYPDRPIRLIVPFAPGGVIDLVARQWSERARPHLGQPIIVDNRGGASGTIGTGELARAKPDGYTIGLGMSGTLVLNPILMSKVGYDPAKDFNMLSILALTTNAIAVHRSIPATTLQEFIAYAKANESKLSYCSAGAGTSTQLAGELLKQSIGTPRIIHVPYKGAGPCIVDLVSGNIPIASVVATGQLLELHRTGQIRVLAVTSPHRLKAAPEIPTATEAGLPALVVESFTGIMAPAQTPEPIIRKLYEVSHQVIIDASMQKGLIDQALEPVVDSTPEAASAYLSNDLQRSSALIKSLGLKQD